MERVFVTASELRAIFNEGLYYERVLSGELVAALASEGVPNPANNMPVGTISQVMHYYTKALIKVAVVHQYRLPSGELHGGRPDPKMLIVNGQRWVVQPLAGH